ncbi:MAG: hypothetical protein ACRDPS_00050 [Nocardioides sp.]|uniref:hypothetical protein n=1 Tax=Nocardioides sp. TaxID=35761 RepID=UPI003D6B663B
MSEYAAEADLEEQSTGIEVVAVDDEAPLDAEEPAAPPPDDVDEADYAEQTLDAGNPDDAYDY